MTLTVGSMCTGYGGVELALTAAGWPVRTVWHAELDPDASAVLAHRWPGVANLGDIRAVDWAEVAPVDVLCAGFPCQDISNAGKRAGIEGSRSGLWANVAAAVRVLRPRLVVLENVAALLGRGMGRVLGDLAALGFDAGWTCLRASDVGAPHRRDRIFITAHPADAPDFRLPGLGPARDGRPGSADGGVGAGGLSLLPTPAAWDADRGAGWGDKPGRPLSETIHRLLPTPRATDGTKGGPNQSSNGGPSLPMTVHQLLPTPTASRYGSNQSASDGAAVRPGLDSVAKLLPTPTAVHWARNATADRTAPRPDTNTDGWTLADVAHADRWGQYAPAIGRWEAILGRPAPDPTEPGRTGKPRLSPPFVEWLMGLPAGHVTAVPGLSRNAQLRLLGNGVVPQQAAAAITDLTSTAMEASA